MGGVFRHRPWQQPRRRSIAVFTRPANPVTDTYGLSSEADSAQPFSASVAITDTFAFPTEIDTVPGLAASVRLTDNYGFGAETDTVPGFTATVRLTDTYGFASEVDSTDGFDSSVRLSDNYGEGIEVDTVPGFAATAFLTDIYDFATEVDTVPGFETSVFLTASFGEASEADAAQPFGASVYLTDDYGFSTEVDTAQAFSASVYLTDTHGFGLEVDTVPGFEATAALTAAFAFTTEVDTAQPFIATVYQTDSYGFASETDTVPGFEATVRLTGTYGFATETDTVPGFIATAFLTDTYGEGVESDTVPGFTASAAITANYNFGAEVDTVPGFTATVRLTDTYAFPTETEIALPFTAELATPCTVSVGTVFPTTGQTNSGAGLNVAMPSGIQPDDIVFVIASIDGTNNPTDPANFSRLEWASFGGASLLIGYIDSDVWGGSPPATMNWKTTSSSNAAFLTFRLIGAKDPDTQVPQLGVTVSYSNNLTPDPPLVAPSGGSGDYLSIAVLNIVRGSDAISISAYPSGYTNTAMAQIGTGSLGVTIAMATKDFSGASEDPGTFTLSGSPTGATGRVATVAIYCEPAITETFSFPTEVDTVPGFAATVRLADTYGEGVETDVALPFSASVYLTDTFGFASEADTALPWTVSSVISDNYGFGAEVDVAGAFQASVYLTDTYGEGVEVDTVPGFEASLTGPVEDTYNFGAEVDSARPWSALVPGVEASYNYGYSNEAAFPWAASVPSTSQAEFDFALGLDIALGWSAYADVEVQPSPQQSTNLVGWNCGEWTVWLADRFGNPRRQLDGIASISGAPLRVIDNVSKVSVSVGPNFDIETLCEIEPWATEIQIRLDGKIEWAGPVQNVTFEHGPDVQSPLTIDAADLLEWLRVRVLRGRVAAGPVAEQFQQIIRQAMAGDDIGLTASATSFVSVEGRLRITDVTDALDEIIDLAPFVDFTMLGRDLLLGGEEVPFTTLPNLILPDHSRTFQLRRAGEDEASQVWMRGGEDFDNDDFDRAVGFYPPTEDRVDPGIGLVQRREYDTSILEPQVATAAAYSYYQYARPPVWNIEVVLDMNRVPFTFHELIAGSTVPVSVAGLPCWDISDEPHVMRIRNVSLEVESGGEDTVTLDLIPAGIFTQELADLRDGLI